MTAFAPLIPALVSTIACGIGGYFLGHAASKTMENKSKVLLFLNNKGILTPHINLLSK